MMYVHEAVVEFKHLMMEEIQLQELKYDVIVPRYQYETIQMVHFRNRDTNINNSDSY